jgi:alpha-mannosidase
MLPEQISFDGVQFHLASAKSGEADAIAAKGQSINLPAGHWNRLYLLAASDDGDQSAAFQIGDKSVDLKIEDWGGFIGQWDDRIWKAKEVSTPGRGGRPARTEMDPYAEMIGIKPGYIKRANLAWYCDFHHDPSGANVAYSYSYLFGYPIELPPGAKTITLPDNDKIRILAISVTDENPALHPAQPLYDTLGKSDSVEQGQ